MGMGMIDGRAPALLELGNSNMAHGIAQCIW